MNLAKKLFICLLSTTFLIFLGGEERGLYGAVKGQDAKNWKPFSSEASGFSVKLPTEPDHIEQVIDIPNSNLSLRYDTYVSEPSDSVVYVVSVWRYPGEIDMSRPEINLQDGFNGMLSALPNAEVQKMEMTKFQGYTALDFMVRSEDIYFQGMLVLVHNTLYQVFSVYKDSENMKDEYQVFIDSFKLVKPEQHNQKVKGASYRSKMSV